MSPGAALAALRPCNRRSGRLKKIAAVEDWWCDVYYTRSFSCLVSYVTCVRFLLQPPPHADQLVSVDDAVVSALYWRILQPHHCLDQYRCLLLRKAKKTSAELSRASQRVDNPLLIPGSSGHWIEQQMTSVEVGSIASLQRRRSAFAPILMG